MSIEMEKLRDNALMKGLILRMFDYASDRALLETEFFNFPDRMELLFNDIDLSFQLFPTSEDMPIITDEAFNTHAKYLHSLRMYYDKKSSLNREHSERLIDVFRYCIRKDPYLAKQLHQEPVGFDNTQNMVNTQSETNTAIAPEVASMEVDTQSNLDKLVSSWSFL